MALCEIWSRLKLFNLSILTGYAKYEIKGVSERLFERFEMLAMWRTSAGTKGRLHNISGVDVCQQELSEAT